MRWLRLAVVLGALWGAAPALAQQSSFSAPAKHVQIELRAARAAIAPGERFTVVLRERIEPGWHTYWRNPGDSGEAPAVSWRLPPGFHAGPLQFPAPDVMPVAMLMNYGYAGEVLLPVEMTAPATAHAGETVTLRADATWLVCSDVCVPEQGSASLTLPIAAAGSDDPDWAPRIAATLAALPQVTPGATITRGGVLSAPLRGAENGRNFHFFPHDGAVIDHAAAEHPRVGPAGVTFTLAATATHEIGVNPIAGVITFETPRGAGWAKQAIDVRALPGAALAGTIERPAAFSSDYVLAAREGAPASPAPQASMGVLAAIALAFLGGLILNIMPCVLPVLSVKALSFVGGAQTGAARRQGVFYAAGVVVTFLVLATILIALRSMGAAVGWGFQLQAPWMSGALALLFFVIGLNLMGVFSIGGALQNTGAGLTRAGGDLGAFFTGALAVIAATPCTAPFMAGAIGMALMQPSALVTLIIFLALAIGFALPLTSLSFAPALLRLLPKPGAWMERARVVLAFPMFLTAAWLTSVVSAETSAAGVTALLGVAAAIAFALVVWRWSRAWLVAAVLALIVSIAVAAPALSRAEPASAAIAQAWSEARVASLRAEGKGVFVNFTAAWCVTCQVNDLSTLRSPRVAEAFSRRNFVYLVADWTKPSDAIAAALSAHGRAGVPLYLYYPPGSGEPVELPQILSETAVLQALGETQ